jgi:opacity protein-like surface antigen
VPCGIPRPSGQTRTLFARLLLFNSSTKLRVAVGAGVECAINRSWSVKGEYLWIGIPGEFLSAGTVPPSTTIISSSRLTDNFQVVRVGVNYKIGAPVVGKY